MNITLISPYKFISSIGLRYLSSCLKRAGHDVQLIFMPKQIDEKYTEKELKAMVSLATNANLIGVSLSTNYFENSIQITKALKNNLKAPIIWGGIHPTVKPEECVEYADIVCRGEGEEAIVELAEKIEKKQNYYNVKNMCFKDNRGGVIINPVRPLIQNLDSLPFPDYDLKNKYIIYEEKSYKMEGSILKKVWDIEVKFPDNPYYMIFISRGCPFGCSYCCNNAINKLYHGQNIFRKRSVDRVIEELKIMRKNLPFIDFVSFNDDNFLMLPLDYIKEFSEKYKKHISLPMIIIGAHPSLVNREKLSYLIKASSAIPYFSMGIQTGSNRGKKIFKRYCSNSQVEKAVKIINEFEKDIKIINFEFIVDNPFETEEDIIETLKLISRLPVPYRLLLFSLTFFPGTELYELAKEKGLLQNERHSVYKKNYFRPKEKIYFNRLFVLFKEYGLSGKKIPAWVVSLLINKTLMRIGLGFFIYCFLRIILPSGYLIVFKKFSSCGKKISKIIELKII